MHTHRYRTFIREQQEVKKKPIGYQKAYGLLELVKIKYSLIFCVVLQRVFPQRLGLRTHLDTSPGYGSEPCNAESDGTTGAKTPGPSQRCRGLGNLDHKVNNPTITKSNA